MTKINKKINMSNLPKHIAFIMDGNGRWAKARGLARHFGHDAGYKSMLTAVERCADLGIKYVSFYAFSTENWKRSEDEIKYMFDIVRNKILKDIEILMKHNIKLMTMGDVTRFPKDLQEKLSEAIEKTKNNDRCTLIMCINYGGRAEIIRAINSIKDVKKVNEGNFGDYLYSANIPDPDLIVRTSGEQRVSNFMLWQMAYSEFLFIKTFWPAINAKIIDKCVIEFQKRKRRFGSLNG